MKTNHNLTLAITNLIKLSGLVVVLYEIFAKATPQPLGMAIAGFMMAGAQLSEDTIISLANKMFAAPHHEQESDSPEPPPQRRRSDNRNATADQTGQKTRKPTPRGKR